MLKWLLIASGQAQDGICPGCAWSSIGEAIDSVLPGTVRQFDVASGNYVENGIVTVGPDRAVTLIGFGAVTVTNSGVGPTFLVTGANAVLIVEGFAITAFNDRAIEVTAGGAADLRNSVLYSIGLQPEGGAVLVDHGSFSARDCLFLDNVATSGGGHLVGRDASVDLQSCLFRGGFARRGGGLLFEGFDAVPTAVTIADGTFEDNLAAESGGAIAISGNVALEISDTVFEENTADIGGALVAEGGRARSPVVTIRTSVLLRNTARLDGGAIASSGASYTVTDSILRENTAPEGGALWIDRGAATLERSLLCRNSATSGGAVFSRTPEPQRWLNNRLIENTAARSGGAIDHAGGLLSLHHHALLGNGAPIGGAILTSDEIRLWNSLVGWTEGSVALQGPTLHEDWNAFWSNVAGDRPATSAEPSRDVAVDPLLERFEPGAGCEAIDDFYSWYGPLRDGGDPTTGLDLDGSRADLGAYGGPDAPSPPWTVDLDGDGFPPLYDCREGDPGAHPEAFDAPYDGLDSDCDRGNDFDIDADGFEIDTDCDDLDPTAYPGAPERPGRGDQNCDGKIDVDGDGYSPPQDCNDEDDRIHPGAVEDADPKVDLDCTPPADIIRQLEPRPCSTAPIPVSGGVAMALILASIRRRR